MAIDETKNTASYKASKDGTVEVNCVTQHDDGDVIMNAKRNTRGMRCHWTIDFKDVTDGELRELASRTVVIEHRKAWRALSPDVSASTADGSVSVRDVLDRQRKPRAQPDPFTAAMNNIDQMSPEHKRLLLEKLGLSLDHS